MPNIAKVLKDEIVRLARRENKQTVQPLKKDIVWLRKTVADLKRRIAELEKDNRLLRAELKREAETEVPSREELNKMRVTGPRIKKLRDRLDVSQAALGQLLGVSAQSVYQWERKEGVLRLREPTLASIKRVREMSKTQAHAELESEGKG